MSVESLKWTSEYEFGLPDIDDEHKSLFGAINRLIETASSDDPAKDIAINVSIEFLIQYVNEHFANEEALFDQTEYPDAEKHKKMHTDLKNKVLDFKERYNQGDEQALIDFVPVAKNWLTNHILNEDKKYVDYCLKADVGLTSRAAI